MTTSRIVVRLTPRGGCDALEGWMLWQGRRVLKARVSAPPENGKANAALVALVAKYLGIGKTSVRLVGGDTSRLKTLEIAGGSGRLETLGDAK